MVQKLDVERSSTVSRVTNPILCRGARVERAEPMRVAFCLLACWWSDLLLVTGAEDASAVRVDDVAVRQSSEVLTNVSRLRAVPQENYLRGCPFRPIGTVTLVDANRHLLVLQDGTVAVAVDL